MASINVFSGDNERFVKNALGACREASLLLLDHCLTAPQAQATADYCARYADWWDAQVTETGGGGEAVQEAFWRARAREWRQVAMLLEPKRITA